MNLKKSSSVIVFLIVLSLFVTSQTFAQSRPRVISNDQENPQQPTQTYKESQPTQTQARPTLSNPIAIQNNNQTPLVKKTVSSVPTNPVPANAEYNSSSLAAFNNRLVSAMQSKLGIRYLFGSAGPNRYDCSGIVWSVFQDAGLPLNRSSARTYCQQFEPVYGDDRFKFGTLVFFNNLGHMGIVVDKDTFYQASSSKGVTFSKFEGYWSTRIVGYRRIPMTLY